MADQSSFLKPILRELTYGASSWKKPVKVVATANVTQTGTQTIDGVALVAEDEVLCVGQTNGAQNGVFVVARGAWARRTDCDHSDELFEGCRVSVTRGTSADAVYRLVTTGTINVGVTSQSWEVDVPAGDVPNTRQMIAGAGLTGGGDLTADRTFNVVANADGSIIVNANDIQVGVLATDGQHGTRGGGTQHAAATTLANGFMSSSDKVIVNNAFIQGGNAFGATAVIGTTDSEEVSLISGTEAMRLFPTGDATIRSSLSVPFITVDAGSGAGTLPTVTLQGTSTSTGATNKVVSQLLNGGASNTRVQWLHGGNVTAEQWSIETDSAGDGTHDWSLVDLAAATRIRVNSSGQVGIGATSLASLLHVLGTETIENATASATANTLDFRKNRAAAIVQNGDELGAVDFSGYDGSAHQRGARILAKVSGTPGATDMPTALSLWTTPDGSATAAEHLTVLPSGFIGIGNNNPAVKLHVDSNAANTVAIIRLENTAGDIDVFRVDATPEGAVTGSRGDWAAGNDGARGAAWLKTTGDATNTGWEPVATYGGTWKEVSTQTGTYTAAWGEIVPYDPTGGGFTINLPTAVGNGGRSLILVNVSASTNTVTADGNSSETINGSATQPLSTARQSTTFTALAGNVVIT